MFGFGSYFACHSSKADIYTMSARAPAYPPGHENSGLRCMLIVRVCLGEPHYERAPQDAHRQWRIPPERPDGRGPLSSVVGVTQANHGRLAHPEFVIYERRQCLPQFAIWYSHDRDCFCTHCVKSKVQVTLCVGRSYSSTFCIPVHFGYGSGVCEAYNELITSSLTDVKHQIRECKGIYSDSQLLMMPNDPNVRPTRNTATPLANGPSLQAAFRANGRAALCGTRLVVMPINRTPAANLVVHVQLDEDRYSVPVTLRSSVLAIKEEIQRSLGIAPHEQRLIFQGMELDDDSLTLADAPLAGTAWRRNVFTLQPRW